MNKTLHTKFGTATINSNGYYRITSRKEGNHDKLLHRLIFADYWQIDDINGFFGEEMDIHHIDGNPLNNELNNLEPMPSAEHVAMHMKGENNHFYGKHHTDEARQQISERMKGKNHPNAKYTLWNIEQVYYRKHDMPDEIPANIKNFPRCFAAKYNGKVVPCGGFPDFLSADIMAKLVMEELEE